MVTDIRERASLRFNRRLSFLVVCGIVVTLTSLALAKDIGVTRSHLEALLNDANRPEPDRQEDAIRRPIEFIEFIGMRKGNRVLEFNAGRGYYARFFALVVGNEGHVYATNAEFVLELFDGIQTTLNQSMNGFDNVTTSVQDNGTLSLPTQVDIVVMNNVNHDLHWQKVDVFRFNRSVYEAIRPGGIIVIADHRAEAGSGTRDASTLHRIEEAIVRDEMAAAGFEIVQESDTYDNADDDHQSFIAAEEIRGHTDRFLLKFRKP